MKKALAKNQCLFLSLAFGEMKQTLSKEERIYKRDELQFLFTGAESFLQFPFKVVHYQKDQSTDSNIFLKCAVSIPKRIFKKAVDRNLLKRRTKEAIRRNNTPFKTKLSQIEKQVLFMVIYIGKEPLPYQKIEEKIILTLQRLQLIYAENSK